ncbi:MAG: GNAT family N-acetyltransferase [Phycisphaerales bacterium]|nr:GNAT family N-acetyltransferase [Phycisphaerales bacterium]
MKTLDSKGLGLAIAQHLGNVFSEVTSSDMVIANERWWRVITHDPHPYANFAIVNELQDAKIIVEALKPLSELELPAGVVFVTVDDVEAVEVVTSLGFSLAGRFPAMALDLTSWQCPACPEGFTMREVDMTHEATAWHQAMVEGYDVPNEVAAMFGRPGLEAGTDAMQARYFGVFKDDQMVATSLACMDDSLGGIYCVTTLAEVRKQGLGEAITGLAIQAIKDAGYPIVVLQSSDMGASIYTRMGFQKCGGIPFYGRNLG